MIARRIRSRHTSPTERSRGQALVELALVMPLLLGVVAVLFQLGVLFISYLSLVHATRDIARFVAVHPDTIDGAPVPPTPPCSSYSPNSLWEHVCTYDVPTVIDRYKIKDNPITTVPCATLDAQGHCATRTTGSMITINMYYDSSSVIFLPTRVRFGPFLNFDVPASWQTMSYDYTVMVEPH